MAVKLYTNTYREQLYLRELESELSTVVDHSIQLTETRGNYVFSLQDYHELNMYPKLKRYQPVSVYDRTQGVTMFYLPKRFWYSTFFAGVIDTLFLILVSVWFMNCIAYFVYLNL